MARNETLKKSGKKRTKDMLIRFEKDKNVFNVILRPIIPFGIRQDVLDEDVLKTQDKNESIESQLNAIKRAKQLLSKEKIRVIHALKHDKPNSVYELAKRLKRDFKAVRQDVRLLEQLGFVKIEKTRIKNRLCSKPVLQFDKINLSIVI